MLDTTSAIGDYQRLFELKVAHFEFLAPAERGGLIEHYQDYCRAVVRHREKNLRDLAGWLDDLEHGRDTRPRTPDGTIAGPGATRAGMRQAIRVAQHTAEQWRAELAWAGSLVGDASGTRAERAQHAQVPSA